MSARFVAVLSFAAVVAAASPIAVSADVKVAANPPSVRMRFGQTVKVAVSAPAQEIVYAGNCQQVFNSSVEQSGSGNGKSYSLVLTFRPESYAPRQTGGCTFAFKALDNRGGVVGSTNVPVTVTR